MKTPQVVGIVLSALLVFVVGVCAGVWFTQHYRIVPVNRGIPQYGEYVPMDATAAPPSATASGRAPAASIPTVPLAKKVRQTGPFQYRFTQGEQAKYTLSAKIDGTGKEFLTPENVSMVMGADFTLATQSVDSAGNADLKLTFDDVALSGDFMGSPFDMRKTPERTTVRFDNNTTLDTAQGQSIAGIPQLEFYDTPIGVTVAPDGQVLNVSGAQGLDALVSPASLMAPIEFPTAEMTPGYTWQSDFDMPVPGLGTPVKSTATNTFRGYQTYNGHTVAVIDQDISAHQQGGVMQSPKSILGGAMQFSMPAFDVSGHNTIYFDTERGQLAHSDMDINFNLQLGKEMKSFAELLNSYGELLNEVEGGKPKPAPRASEGESDKDLMDLGLNIKAQLDLKDAGSTEVSSAP